MMKEWKKRKSKTEETLAVFLIISFFFHSTEARCVMGGSCFKGHYSGLGEYHIPCKRLVPSWPSSLPHDKEGEKAILQLSTWCPHLANEPDVCCSIEQVASMDAQLRFLNTFIGSCPACYANFARIWCDFTCHPNQAMFVSVDRTLSHTVVEDREKKTQSYVSDVKYHINERFISAALESCSKVDWNGQKALQLICGIGGECANEWTRDCLLNCLKVLGNKNDHRMTPINIDFVLWPEKADESPLPDVFKTPQTSLNDVIPCTGTDTIPACSCAQCPQSSCSNNSSIEWLHPFVPLFSSQSDDERDTNMTREVLTLGQSCLGYPCYMMYLYFLVVIAALFLLILFFSYHASLNRKVTETCKKTVKFARNYGGTRDLLDTLQRRLARWYAGTVLMHTYIVFFAFVLLSITFIFGIFWQHLVKDPIDIWTAPSSRSRMEKDTFDKDFGALPRYTQIVIRPSPRMQSFQFAKKTWGSVFNLQFQAKSFDLVESVLKLTTTVRNAKDTGVTTIGLEDVCYRVFGNQSGCYIVSPFGYFQSNTTSFRFTSGIDSKIDFPSNSTVDTANGWMIPLKTLEEAEISDEEESDDDVFGDDFGGFEVGGGNSDDKVLSIEDIEEKMFNLKRAGHLTHYAECIENPMRQNTSYKGGCVTEFGGPMIADLVFGGWSHKDGRQGMSKNERIIELSDSLILTIMLDPNEAEWAEDWEGSLINKLLKFSDDDLYINFVTERSIKDEIDRASVSDVAVIAICYALMASYVVFGLAQYTQGTYSPWAMLVVSKIFVGFMATFNVAMAVVSVMGFMGWIGEYATLMCLEFLPFLICAIGVNNMFLFVKTYQRLSLNPELYGNREERVTETCIRVLPSMFATSFTQCVCCLSSAFSSMPVLKTFAYYASLGVITNFLLTLTVFVPVFVKDIEREEQRKYDLLCCMNIHEKKEVKHVKGFFHGMIETFYAPFIFKGTTRVSVMSIQFCLVAVSILLVPRLQIGLDQKMSVPQDSYVYTFMESIPTTLSSTVPLHFIVRSTVEGKGINMSDPELRKLFCSSSGCNDNSLGNLISRAVSKTNGALITQSAYNWVDDYIGWLSNNGAKSCCRVWTNGTYCQPGIEDTKCNVCIRGGEAFFTKTQPHNDTFYRHLNKFLTTPPSLTCPIAGGMAHFGSVNITRKGLIKSFYMRTFHAPFNSSAQFIEGLHLAREITREFTRILKEEKVNDLEVFAYSPYYVFYDQYLHIGQSTSSQLALSTAVAFCALVITMASPYSALLVILNTFSATLCLVAYMFVMGIELNALTIVNLAMSLGILLEFFVHFVHAYSESGKTERVERATEALINVGSTVSCGIVMTKLLGLLVLAFAHSQIFRTYYFLFYVGLVPIGAIHGLLFLPIQLSFFGPHLYERRYNEQLELDRKDKDLKKTVIINGSPDREILIPNGSTHSPLLSQISNRRSMNDSHNEVNDQENKEERIPLMNVNVDQELGEGKKKEDGDKCNP